MQQNLPASNSDKALRIRAMQIADVAAVSVIEQESYCPPWSSNIFINCIDFGHVCSVLEYGQTIIGYGILARSRLLNLCVHPEFRRLGMGKKILFSLIGKALAKKARLIYLEVRPSNEWALHLYRCAGFDQIAICKNYYPAKTGGEDAYLLARNL